jgi:hypothetical protein
VDGVGEGQGLKEQALRLDDEPDNRTPLDVQYARADQILVHDRIEVRVIDNVVDVPVDVVVHPARRYTQEVGVACPDLLTFHDLLFGLFHPPSLLRFDGAC